MTLASARKSKHSKDNKNSTSGGGSRNSNDAVTRNRIITLASARKSKQSKDTKWNSTSGGGSRKRTHHELPTYSTSVTNPYIKPPPHSQEVPTLNAETFEIIAKR